MTWLHTKKKPCHPIQQGFTLLELLLVIVIIGFLLGAFTFTQKKHSANTQATKVAAEMRELTIAAQRYYDMYGYWPSNITLLTASNTPFQLNSCGPMLLSTTSNECQKNNSYHLSFPSGYGAGIPGTNVNKAGVVYISTIAPNNDMAELIASQLPAANVNYTTHEVRTVAPALSLPAATSGGEISLPDLMNQERMVMIKSIYTDLIGKNQIRNGNKLTDNLTKDNFLKVRLPMCPANWTPGYDVAMNQYYVLKDPVITSTDLVTICKQKYSFTPQDSGGYTEFTISGKRTQGSSYHAGSVMVISYCVPPSLNNDKNLLAKFTEYNDAGSGRNGGFNQANKCYFANFKSTNGY